MCTTGSEDAVTVQAGTFSWDRNERPILEKCVCACVHMLSNLHLYNFALQYQSEHQAWSVGGSSGSRGSW